MKRMQRLLVALVVGMVMALLAVPSRRLAQEGGLGGNDEAEAAAKGQVAGDRERLLDREAVREGAPKGDKPGAWSAATQGPIVGPYIRITTDTVQNRDPAVAYNSVRDEFLVVWHQEISSTNWGIFARRISAAGALVGSTITIDAVGLNRWPEVAYNPSTDEYLVVYTYDDVSVGDADIWGRRVSGDGTPLAFITIDLSDGDQYKSAVAFNSTDQEYLVVYKGSGLVLGRRITSDGSLIGSLPTLIAERYVDAAKVAYNPWRNQYLVVYFRSDLNIFARRANSTLDLFSEEFPIGRPPEPASNLWDMEVAAGPDEYVVVWGLRNDAIYYVWRLEGRRVRGDGTVADWLYPSPGSKRVEPAIAYAPPGSYLVAWSETEYNGDPYLQSDVYGRRVMGGEGSAMGDRFGIDTTLRGQLRPALACAGDGRCFVVEEDYYFTSTGEIGGWFVRLDRVHLPVVAR